MVEGYVNAGGGLQVSQVLYDAVGTMARDAGIDKTHVWSSLGSIVADLAPKNAALLKKRSVLQSQIDAWHKDPNNDSNDAASYQAFLEKIGYIVPRGGSFEVTTQNIDPEFSEIAGPQLVVPVDNPRFATNAANARWGSLYDALYGSDVIPEDSGLEKQGPKGYNPARGAEVINRTNTYLDDFVALNGASYGDVTGFYLKQEDGVPQVLYAKTEGGDVALADPDKFVGYLGEEDDPTKILFKNNELHIELTLDRDGNIGRTNAAGIQDVTLESAVTTIIDLEDSVSAMDAEDKTNCYLNWHGLMKGNLVATKAEHGVDRELAGDRTYFDPSGHQFELSGRSTMLIRNVGIHLHTDAVLYKDQATGETTEIPEGFLDAMLTALSAKIDFKTRGEYQNSKTGSMYVVKPKLHGPEEVAATVELFGRVEKALGLPEKYMKIGIMDEEMRTTVNLHESIRAAQDRVIFINTGFLDRTGDLIYTAMHAGPMDQKAAIKANSAWFPAYEDHNVNEGIATGVPMIGKGMFPKPDAMAEMVKTKIEHPLAGADAAWVPSPTAATLHALHYHMVNVADKQKQLVGRDPSNLETLVTIPLTEPGKLSSTEIARELDRNAQSTLGYVSRWVGQGIGCSKVPDVDNVGLMEDLATLRISTTHMANWLQHGVVTEEQVMDSLKRMAKVVDLQNHGDDNYTPMADNWDAPEFTAAVRLIKEMDDSMNGYTERVLREERNRKKTELQAA